MLQIWQLFHFFSPLPKMSSNFPQGLCSVGNGSDRCLVGGTPTVLRDFQAIWALLPLHTSTQGTYTHTHTHVCTNTSKHVSIHAHTHTVHAHMCTYMYTPMCALTGTPKHTGIHPYTDTHAPLAREEGQTKPELSS